MKILRWVSAERALVLTGRSIAYLINPTELEMDLEVFFVQRLETRVEQTAHQGRFRLLDYICSSMFRGFGRDERV